MVSKIFYIGYYIYSRNLLVGDSIMNFSYIFKEIFYDGDYDRGYDLNNSVVFDVGANMGLFSLWINDKFSNMKVHCFEPLPALYKICEHNLKSNEKSNNKFYIHNIGLSNKNEIVTMNYFPNANGLSTATNDMDDKSNKLQDGYSYIVKKGTEKSIPVNVKMMLAKKFIIENNIQHIDFCKIDVEGFELAVVEGFGDFVNIVDVFIIEVENYRKDNLKKILDHLENFDVNILNEQANWCMITARRKRSS
jgi:FkbM family methyltransferase